MPTKTSSFSQLIHNPKEPEPTASNLAVIKISMLDSKEQSDHVARPSQQDGRGERAYDAHHFILGLPPEPILAIDVITASRY